MPLSRRDMLKVSGLTLAATAVGGCQPEIEESSQDAAALQLMDEPKGNRVVVIGGGFGGLTFAKRLRVLNKDAEVVLIEKRDIFISCPYSNLYLGGVDGVKFTDLTHDYYDAAATHGYTFIQAEVTAIDRKIKTIVTTKGEIGYDLLVMSPGIAYDYQKQFPSWDTAKIRRASHETPGALIPGSEHLALKRMLENLEGGNVIVTVPEGKYRCPPAPYERAAMIANYIKKEDIDAKVIIIDSLPRPKTKAAAFMEAYGELYKGIVEFRGECYLEDVDFDAKQIKYRKYRNVDDEEGFIETLDYAVLNLIPLNRANPLIEMAGIETTGWGSAVLREPGFKSVTDRDIYVIGDCVSYPYPESGQMASSMALICAEHVSDRLSGKTVDEAKKMPANVCYSMVGENPEEAIMVTHKVTYDPKTGLSVKGNVPKDEKSGKYRTRAIAKGTHEWFKGIMRDMFA